MSTPLESTCLSCAIVSGHRETIGGIIAQTSRFHVHQDVAYPVPGLVIVAAKRHLVALDEMDPVETAELLPFLQAVRKAQRRVLKSDHTYYFYNEDTRHHFHVWMVPRLEWMRPFGKSVESLRPALRHAAAAMSDESSLAAVATTVGALRDAMAVLMRPPT
jgi:diadenosine tetraphosphate (Ap4A) HIT family hydrolase